MRIKELCDTCIVFEKMAQSFEQRNYEQLSATAKEQLERYNAFAGDQNKASKVFSHMNQIRSSGLPAANISDDIGKDPVYNEGKRIILQLEYFGERYQNILISLGVNPATLQTMINNLKIVMDSNNFSGYKAVTLSGINQTSFEIEDWEGEQDNKKDLGF